MNDRGCYGINRRNTSVGVAPSTAERPSEGFSWGGLIFFGLAGGGLLMLARPHFREVRDLERSRRAAAQRR